MLRISSKYPTYCFLAFAFFLSTVAHSTPMDDAFAALNQVPSDRSTAEKIYLGEAKKGNPEAYSMLGYLYLGNYGGETDQTKSREYFQKAFSLYLKAAKNGDIDAQESLGQIYSDESSSKRYGVEKNVETSKKWYSMNIATYKKRAEAGDPESIRMLARAYRFGKGVEANANEASRLYKLAVSKGSLRAKYDLGEWMTQFPKYKEAGLHMLEDAASEGSREARGLVATLYRDLGNDYENGNGVPIDSTLAFQNFMKAASYGNVYSMFKVGMALHNGNGTGVNKSEAISWFQKAAMNGHTSAQYNFGYLLATGNGIAPDFPRAYKCLVLADKGGIKEARPLMSELESRMQPLQLINAKISADRWKEGEEL